MQRVSSGMMNNTVQYNLRSQESRLNAANNQLGSQQRIQSLRDDPIAAGHLVRYQSYLTRVEQFGKNAQTLADQYQISEGYMNQSLQIVQRLRELAVTGATGTYTKEDLQNMAAEVNELLGELVQNANAVGPDGTALFAGSRTKGTPFEVEMGTVPGAGSPVISAVRCNGTVRENSIEVDERAFLETQRAGNRMFWAEPQMLISRRDASDFRAASDSVISVDGMAISINAGDSVYAVAAKINDSGAAVKASIDPESHGINLQTTDARQLWLEDVSGSVLSDLGIVKDASQRPPYNTGDSVRVTGGSLFDSVIALRDAMYRGDSEAIGGRVLGSLDSGINNLTTRLAENGALYERAQANIERNAVSALNANKLVSREGDLDFTKAVTDMKMMEYVQQATLSTAARLYENSLLNYMR